MSKQNDFVATQVTAPVFYDVSIQGMGGIIINKKPELSQPKGTKKRELKQDLAEKEQLTWREKLHFDENEDVFIPSENIHECMKGGAAYWGEKVTGNKTYTDLVKCGLNVESLYFPGLKKDSPLVVPFGKMVNASPTKPNGGSVWKIRPLLQPWGGTFKITVFDPRLTEKILQTILTYAGIFRGLCDWRPKYGRFTLTGLEERRYE